MRHDDPRLGPYMPMAAVVRSASSLASDVEGLRLVLETAVGAHYRIEVPDDGSDVRLRRLDRSSQVGHGAPATRPR